MKTNKDIETFTKYIMNEAGIEKPSADFVNSVMDKISIVNKPVLQNVYEPLISKLGWFLIAVLFGALYIFVLTETPQNSTILSKINLNFLSKISAIHIFEGIHIPTIFTFIFVIFTVLFLVQLVVIKNYFNKNIFEN